MIHLNLFINIVLQDINCSRRLRGSGGGVIAFHGLTPTAKCGRRIRGLLEPRAGTRGIVS